MEKNKRISYLLPLLLTAILAAGVLLGFYLKPTSLSISTVDGSSKEQKMRDILEILDKYYVDSINEERVFEETIGDMLHKLDPHSNYIPAEEIKRANEQIQGHFGGVGIRFFILRDTICVTNVVAGSPSDQVGVMAGDQFLKIDGKKVAGAKVDNDGVMGLLKGPEGTKVKVELLRQGKKVSKTIIRGQIPIESVTCAYMIRPGIGFIRIEQFSVTTDKEFRAAAYSLKQKGMKKVILDLRNNGGGVLQTATAIADEFLRTNLEIVSTKGLHNAPRSYVATPTGMCENMDVVVLINENSASASEILAGALQDHDRATIVGRRSFGKGLVQEDMVLRDGSNLRLTIARYYTPTGRSIQKPYSGGFDQYYTDQYDRYDNGELYAPDSSLFVDSLKYKTPKGKIVYGGGGIMPDVFVPLDTTGSSWWLTQLRYSMAIQSFSFDYVRNQRSKWNSVQSFNQGFTVSDQLILNLAQFAEKHYQVKKESKDLAYSKSRLKSILKAEIARQIWIESGYYQVANVEDREVQIALQQFKK